MKEWNPEKEEWREWESRAESEWREEQEQRKEIENVNIEGVPESEKADFLSALESFSKDSGIIVIPVEGE